MKIDWLPYCEVFNDPKKYDSKLYLKEAYYVASKSTDPSTTNGAIIVSQDSMFRSISACNSFPTGVKETEQRWNRDVKYSYVEHAERNVIFKCFKLGIPTKNPIMYCTWYACCDCARAIIQSGITKVIGHAAMLRNSPDRWKDSIIRAFEMMESAKIECYAYDGQIFENNPPQLRFNGEIWKP